MEMYESYVKQIQRYALLTSEQENELSRQIQQGNRQALTSLVQSNLRLVVSIAKKFNMAKFSIMDLIQEGNIGLMTAAEKYNYSFKTRFSTYAYSWILQYMLRYLYSKTSLIPLPHRKDELIRRVAAAQGFLFQSTGHEPDVTELSVYLGVPEQELHDVLRFSYSVGSIDSPCGEDGVTIGDLLPDTTFEPEQNYMVQVRKNGVHRLVASLPAGEQKVIFNRYNLGCDLETKTLREISGMLGVSAETVRQMEIRAIRRMKQTARVEPELMTQLA
jgi:RNA polymerase primary sigma factor